MSTLFRDRAADFGETKLVGIIKEVAPTKGVATDEELGVAEFQEKYFKDFPVYLDLDLVFYEAFGKRNLLFQSWSSWNPFAVYGDLKSLGDRLKRKGIEGNLKGEGFTQGGIIFMSPTSNEVVHMIHEKSGSELPVDEIVDTIQNMNKLSDFQAPKITDEETKEKEF